MELYAEKEKVGNNCGTTAPNINPDPWPDGLHGIAPSRFDHCLLYGDDLDGTVKLFTQVLGFSIAEQVMAGPDKNFMIGAFLSCSNKAHDVAFIRQPVKGKFHHASFELGSWEKVLRAADILSRTKTSIDIGPTRHGITRGETMYFFDPSGNRNEVFAGGYIYYPDKPPITWYDETARAGDLLSRPRAERGLPVGVHLMKIAVAAGRGALGGRRRRGGGGGTLGRRGRHQGQRRGRRCRRQSGGVPAHARRLPAFDRHRDRQGLHRGGLRPADRRLDRGAARRIRRRCATGIPMAPAHGVLWRRPAAASRGPV